MGLNVGSIIGFVGVDNSDYLSGVNETIRAGEKMAKTMERQFKAISKSMQAMGKTMSIAVTAPLTILAKTADKTSLSLARAQTRLEFATGGANEAAEAMSFITSEVDRLGIALMPSTEGFSNFAAAAKGTALEGQGARDIFTGLSQAAATLSLASDQTSGAMKALEQIMSKGNVQAEELRGQLGERIPGAFQIASRAMGVTTQELNKMLDRGEVLSTEFLPKFAAELKRTFTEPVPRAVRAVNEFSNSFILLKKSLADAGISQALTNIRIVAAELMKQFIALDPPVRRSMLAIAAISAAIGPLLFVGGKMFSLFGSLIGVFGKARVGLIKLVAGVAGLVIPLAAAALGVALLIDAFGSLLPSTQTIGKAFIWVQGIWKETVDFWKGVVGNILGNTKTLSEGQKTAVEFIAKVWLSLKIAWNAVAVGLQTIVKGITDGISGMLDFLAGVAEKLKLETISKKLEGAAKGFDGISLSLSNAREENLKTWASLVDSWGKAPDILRSDLSSFKMAVSEMGAQALEGIKGLAPEAVEKIRGLIGEINSALIAGNAGVVNIPVQYGAEQFGPELPPLPGFEMGPGTKKEIEAFFEWRAQAEFEAMARVSGILRDGTEVNKSIWDIYQADSLRSLENWKERAAGIFIDFRRSVADSLAATIVSGKSFGKSMVSTFQSMGQRLLSMAFENALARISINEGVAVSNAAATAPTPFMIPLFAGLAIAAFSAAMANTPFGGGGGGGGAAITQPATVAPAIAAVSRIETEDEGQAPVEGRTKRLIVETSAGEQLLDVLVRATKNGKGAADDSDRFALAADVT
jgi:tape measure domain-containing protein